MLFVSIPISREAWNDTNPRINRDKKIRKNTNPALSGLRISKNRMGIVRVDALKILCLDLERVDIWIGSQLDRHIANQILDKNRILIGELRDRLLVRTLEKRV